MLKLILLLAVFAFSLPLQASSLIDKIARAPMSQVRSWTAEVAQGYAKEAPKQINRNTWLQGTSFVEATDTLIYYYQINASPNREVLRQQLVAGVCSNEVLHALMKRGIVIQYYYASYDNSHLFTENVNSSNCE